MPWQQENPLAVALNVGLGTASAMHQAKVDNQTAKAAAERQAQQDQIEAALKGAQTENYKAETAKTGTDVDLKKRATGFGLAPAPQPAKGNSVKEQLDNAMSAYQYYTAHGATELADRTLKVMNDLRQQQGELDKQTLALREQMRKELHDKAEAEHWTNTERIQAQHNVDQMMIAAGHDATSLAAAREHSNAIISAASIGASSRWQLEQSREKNQRGLAQEHERGLDRRAAASQQGQAQRFNAGADNRASAERALFGITNPGGQVPNIPVRHIGGQQPQSQGLTQKAKLLPTKTRAMIKQALNNGHSAQDIMGTTEAQGLSADDINSINDAPDDED